MKLLHFHAGDFVFPAREPPAWAAKVERWVQLDSFAFLLPEAFTRWEKSLGSRPSLMLLTGFGASNITDSAFARSGAQSPTKFVHTLPNIRSSSLLAVMGWSGPVLSLHRDPCSLAAGFREALRHPQEEVWLWHVTHNTVDLFAFHSPEGPYQVLARGDTSTVLERPDSAILDWFSADGGVNFDISQQWMVVRNG